MPFIFVSSTDSYCLIYSTTTKIKNPQLCKNMTTVVIFYIWQRNQIL